MGRKPLKKLKDRWEMNSPFRKINIWMMKKRKSEKTMKPRDKIKRSDSRLKNQSSKTPKEYKE